MFNIRNKTTYTASLICSQQTSQYITVYSHTMWRVATVAHLKLMYVYNISMVTFQTN
jgi:hypothetical protein